MFRRVRIYLVGVFLGCIMVYFMLIRNKDRDLLGWLPNKKILSSLNHKNSLKTDKAICKLACYQISETEYQKLFKDGDVLISESFPRKNPKIYFVQWENVSGQNFKFAFELTEHYSRLTDITLDLESNTRCNCE